MQPQLNWCLSLTVVNYLLLNFILTSRAQNILPHGISQQDPIYQNNDPPPHRERERRNNSISEKTPPPVSITMHHSGRKLTVLSQPPSGGQVIPSHNTNILLRENAYENDTCSAGKVAGIIHQNDSCLMVNITHHSHFTGKLWVPFTKKAAVLLESNEYHSPKRQLFYWTVMSTIHQKGSCFTGQ